MKDKLYYNLSDEEIAALMNEIKDEANGNTLAPNDDFLYQPQGNGYYNEQLNLEPIESKSAVCFHEWKNYLGLNESFDYCTKCGIKK